MRQTLRTAALMLALCCSAFAGITPTPPVVTPPPPAASGDMHTGAAESTPEVDGLTEIALGLLQSVLTLL